MNDYENTSPLEIQKIRVAVRARQKYHCLFCDANLEDVGMMNSVHHIVPRAFGGKLTEDNCVCVCNSCHNKLEVLNRRMITGVFNYLLDGYGVTQKFKLKNLEKSLLKMDKLDTNLNKVKR